MNELLSRARQHLYEENRDIFPKDPAHFERCFREKTGLEFAAALAGMFSGAAGLAEGARVLDVGCGYGTFVLACRQRGYDAAGVDTGAYEIEFARKRMAEEAGELPGDTYRCAPAETLPYPDASFDAVTLWNVLEHVRDYRAVLREADRVLKPGGTLVLLAPNYLSFRKEAHYQLPWLPLMPKGAARRYLRLCGRDPGFLMRHIHYVTGIGVSSLLLRLGYRLGVDRLGKLDGAGEIASPAKRLLIPFLRAVGGRRLLAALILMDHFNPLKTTITVFARKGEKA